jgi:hypothetical protein
MCLRRPIDGECFRAYVEQQLVPVLQPGDIVVLYIFVRRRLSGTQQPGLDPRSHRAFLQVAVVAAAWEAGGVQC